MAEGGEARAVIGRREAAAPPVRPGDDSDDGGGLGEKLTAGGGLSFLKVMRRKDQRKKLYSI